MSAAVRAPFLSVVLAAGAIVAWSANPPPAPAARTEELTWAVKLAEKYPTLITNVTYYTANGYDQKLDIYMPAGNDSPKPTVVYFHGGGWMAQFNKNSNPFIFLPILQLGWNVVNVEYRPGSVSLAPAAVEDCLCALRWVVRNAIQYHIDAKQIVLMGHSAGGLLALTTGMIPLSTSGLGGPCVYDDGYGPSPRSARLPEPSIKPAAIVSWAGPTDIADLAEGPNPQPYSTIWLGKQSNHALVARMVSPLSYVRVGLPPIISIHGDEDPLVPYSQDLRLHDALDKVGVTNKLVTISGGGHALFGVDATREAWIQVFEFLEKAGLTVRTQGPKS